MADKGHPNPSAPGPPNPGVNYQYQQFQGQPPPGTPYGAQGGMPFGPPPPYSPATVGSYPVAAAPMGAPPPYAAHGYGYPAPGPQTTVVMPTGFDSGARFDGASRPNIPPPPPGIAPNAAQLAMMQGQNVVMGQKKESFLGGGKGGGYTFW